MTDEVIRRLNTLNRDFYRKISGSFSDSRQAPWLGWEKMLPYLEKVGLVPSDNVESNDTSSNIQNRGLLNVLDIGCGNGRFGRFLNQKLPGMKIDYLGVDSSVELLNDAAAESAHWSGAATFQEADIVENLLSGKLLNELGRQFDLIALFGVLHHIPSFELRKKLLVEISNFLKPGGMCCLSAWQFKTDERLMQRSIEPSGLGFQQDDLEENDHFLTWERGDQAVRYCHEVSQSELNQLVDQTSLHQAVTFREDGRNHRSNLYGILEKKSL